MGMKPRKKAKPNKVTSVYGVLTKHTQGCIDAYAGGVRELLKEHKVPQKYWPDIWNSVEDWPDADADQDLQWFLGWFNGAAEALGCNLEDLVVL